MYQSKLQYIAPMPTALPTLSFLGTGIVANNLAHEYANQTSSFYDWTKMANIAGFNDPVIGALFCLATVLLAVSTYKYYKFDQILDQEQKKITGNEETKIKESLYKGITSGMAGAAVLGSLVIYAIVAGALSVSDTSPALSKDMIGSHASEWEMAGYFGGYALLGLGFLAMCYQSKIFFTGHASIFQGPRAWMDGQAISDLKEGIISTKKPKITNGG